jgi:ERCC4-related helicase
MCGELRGATRQEMHDFVLGKRVRPTTEGNVVELLSPSREDGDDNDQQKKRLKETSTTSHRDKSSYDSNCENDPNRNISRPTNNDINNRYFKNLPSTVAYATNKTMATTNTPMGGSGVGIIAANTSGTTSDVSPLGGTTTSSSSLLLNPYGSTQNPSSLHSKTIQQQEEEAKAMAAATGMIHPNNQQQLPEAETVNTTTSESVIRKDSPEDRHSSNIAVTKNLVSVPNTTTEGTVQKPHPKEISQLHPLFTNKPVPVPKKKSEEPRVRLPYTPGPVVPDETTRKTWIYPQHDDYPTRQYQLEMTETALNYNTLVSLPTGLGKTHIAAVVMYNFYRWFTPKGKIIFLAPTLPLVNQQVDACYKIMRIPAEDTAVMTGRLKADQRRMLWEKRRLFFCTPQTVEKDLRSCLEEAEETGVASISAFAQQVVCLVLDEAHKTTGNYAYVNVINLLEQAGAHFRILGLSATPGGTIKAVQDVVDNLKSVKIEARTEMDPSVAQYIHEKEMEIVICPRNNKQREIERDLTNLISPLLDCLREQGGLRQYGNATIHAFSVQQAMDNYLKTMGSNKQGHVIGTFVAAQQLVRLRTECHQSLGSVKAKMIRLMNGHPAGKLSAIVRSNEFQSIFEKVKAATEDGDGTGGPTLDPKLCKLGEILQQHFERANATGKSSRAIVFAQFRDNVAEIVTSLEKYKPIINARYFVGQGKGSGGTSNSKDEDSAITADEDRVKGMKQSEQQKVIRHFHEGIFNVLICTSIGEEGLDIGTVDLIVNFDVTGSPIRTIQRAGRTGRQRDGRVICLISEGEEENKHEKRVASERTLNNALKNPKRFKVASHRPILPEKPVVEYRKMENQSQIHLSQVAGAQKTPSTAKRASSRGRNGNTAWQLDMAEELERENLCGDLKVLDHTVTWKSLKKFFLKSRVDPSKDSKEKHVLRERLQKQRTISGRCTSILNELKQFGPIHSAGSTRIGYQGIKEIFHVDPAKYDHPHTVRASKSTVSKNIWREEHMTDQNQRQSEANQLIGGINDTEEPVVGTSSDPDKNVEKSAEEASNGKAQRQLLVADRPVPEYEQLPEAERLVPEYEQRPAIGNHEAADVYQQQSPSSEPLFELRTASSSSSSSSSDESDDESDMAPMPQPAAFLEPPSEVLVDPSLEHQKSEINPTFNVPGQGEKLLMVGNPTLGGHDKGTVHESLQSVENGHCPLFGDQADAENDTLDASSYLQEMNSTGSASDNEMDIPLIALKSKYNEKYSKGASSPVDFVESEEDVPLISLKKKTVEKKRHSKGSNTNGPPSEKFDDSGKGIGSKASLLAVRSPEESRLCGDVYNEFQDEHNRLPPTNDSQDVIFDRKSVSHGPRRRRITESPDSAPSVGDDVKKYVGNQSNMKQQSVAEPELHFSRLCNESIHQRTPIPPRDKLPWDTNVLQGTPETSGAGDKWQGQIKGVKGFSSFDPLTNTPAGAASCDDIVCQVCMSGDFTSEDPIVLCDACNLGFHQFCYSIPKEKVASDDPWFCDCCMIRSKRSSTFSAIETICVFCRKQSGALKKSDIGWCHPLCSLFSSRLVSESCYSCLEKRAVRCDECSQAIHPYCAIESGWTIVKRQTEASSSIFCPEHSHKVVDTNGVRVIRISGNTLDKKACRPKKLVKKISSANCSSYSPVSTSECRTDFDEVEAKKAKIQRRREVLARFVLEEADIGSDEDLEGDVAEEEELRRLEEEEALSQDSFINDNAVLTQHFSQDELGEVDPDAADADFDYTHRALDAQRDRENQFKTPNFNRRMMRQADEGLSVPSSQRGLGQMHFIRSVLEHHRQGGDCDEIEQCYKQMEREWERHSSPSSPYDATATAWANAAADPLMQWDNNNTEVNLSSSLPPGRSTSSGGS